VRQLAKAAWVVICIGNANVDVYPDSDEEFFGGSAANTAVRLADLAMEGEIGSADPIQVHLLAAVGTDARGESIVEQLTTRGVCTDYLFRIRGESQQSGITLGETGDREISRGERKVVELGNRVHELYQQGFFSMGPAGNLLPTFLNPPIPWVHVKAQVPVLQAAAQEGIWIGSLDLGSIENADDWMMLTPQLQVSVLSGNEEEVARAGGIEALWANPAVEFICIKQGSRGATLELRNELEFLLDPFPVDAVDTTGAGDAFNAGIIWGILHRWTLGEIGLLACALGALTCTERGAQNPPVTYIGLRDIGYSMPWGRR